MSDTYTVTYFDGETLEVPGHTTGSSDGNLAVLDEDNRTVAMFPQSVIRSIVRKTDPTIVVTFPKGMLRCESTHPVQPDVQCEKRMGHERDHQCVAVGRIWPRKDTPTPADLRRMGLTAPPRPEGHNPVG